MKRRWKWALGGAGAVVALAMAGLTAVVGAPRNWYGFLRYGLPGLHAGTLKAGDEAPDVELNALDGGTFQLRARVAGRPLVLVFGSFT